MGKCLIPVGEAAASTAAVNGEAAGAGGGEVAGFFGASALERLQGFGRDVG